MLEYAVEALFRLVVIIGSVFCVDILFVMLSKKLFLLRYGSFGGPWDVGSYNFSNSLCCRILFWLVPTINFPIFRSLPFL